MHAHYREFPGACSMATTSKRSARVRPSDRTHANPAFASKRIPLLLRRQCTDEYQQKSRSRHLLPPAGSHSQGMSSREKRGICFSVQHVRNSRFLGQTTPSERHVRDFFARLFSQGCVLAELKRRIYMCFSASRMDSSIIRIAQSACSSSMMSGGDMRIEFSPEPSVSNPR